MLSRSLYRSAISAQASTKAIRPLHCLRSAPRWTRPLAAAPGTPRCVRGYASGREADLYMDAIQEQYATAKDEFEIASEETESKTVYAADDRKAAREELDKLRELYDAAVGKSGPDVSAEIKLRVGSRIRELESAVKNMEETATHE
ncbi:MAG: hypothetical protein M1819_002985 [Sarea resinae]|nr:MAG: hypothetical protein M1819_002985 [Sarea resinae]